MIQEMIKKLLTENGVAEGLLGQIMPMLENVQNLDQAKEVLSGFQDQLPAGIMDKVSGLDLGGLGNMGDKAEGVIDNLKGMFGM
jgi:hypothetical protein